MQLLVYLNFLWFKLPYFFREYLNNSYWNIRGFVSPYNKRCQRQCSETAEITDLEYEHSLGVTLFFCVYNLCLNLTLGKCSIWYGYYIYKKNADIV